MTAKLREIKKKCSSRSILLLLLLVFSIFDFRFRFPSSLFRFFLVFVPVFRSCSHSYCSCSYSYSCCQDLIQTWNESHGRSNDDSTERRIPLDGRPLPALAPIPIPPRKAVETLDNGWGGTKDDAGTLTTSAVRTSHDMVGLSPSPPPPPRHRSSVPPPPTTLAASWWMKQSETVNETAVIL